MNKTAVKNFAVWARNKLIADVRYRAGLAGITEAEIKPALPQSGGDTEFYDIGTATPYALSGQTALRQRRNLAGAIRRRAADAGYEAAYRSVMEEAAYTWFNRLIAVRFMEVNGYLPGGLRALSSESGKIEPDLVTEPFDAGLSFTPEEEAAVLQMKQDNQLDELFRLLFVKECSALSAVLPALFQQNDDYTELLLNLSVVDRDGVVWRLTHDIPETDFNVEQGGQVEIIGWLYQYYNTEPKAQVFARPSGRKIQKEEIPAATQLFTPDWIVRYMVENSLGRLWLEGHPDGELRANWRYYLDEAEQEPEAAAQLEALRAERRSLRPENIRIIDPCMGSGHILVYAFDLLMQIYEKAGWERREAVRSIVERNLCGLDIDKRAYQLAYFAVMMKARQYDRRFLTRGVKPQVYYPGEDRELEEFGSLLQVERWEKPEAAQTSLADMADNYRCLLAGKYDVVCTNPPYMGGAGMSGKLAEFVKKNYPDSKPDLFAVFIERCGQLAKQGGYQALITQHAWMFLSSFEKLRKKLQAVDTVNMAHLGARAFEEIGGEVVQTTSFVMRRSHVEGYKGIYCRLIEPNTQKGKEEMFLAGANHYVTKQDNYTKIPGAPVAYWVSGAIYNIFDTDSIKMYFDIKAGICTGKNEVFILQWYEVDFTKSSLATDDYLYTPHNKGGEFRKWYGNREVFLKYNENALNFMENNAGFRHDGKEYYFLPHIGWSKITSSKSSFRFYEKGFTFDSAGLGLFTSSANIMSTLALLNSKVVEYLIAILNPTLNVTPMVVKRLPYVDVNLSELVECNISLSRADWDSFETSWDFQRHPLVRCASFSMEEMAEDLKHHIHDTNYIREAFVNWSNECYIRFDQLKANEEELNRIFIDIYGLQGELTPEVEDRDVTVRRADLGRDIRSLLSYAVGCMFGRYSLDAPGLAYAGGPWDAGKYSSFQPCAGNILPLTDEAYLEDDIVTRLCAWLRVVYGPDTLEENLTFIAKALGTKGGTPRECIRTYFLKDFFADHCKIYQKRPIYWLFDGGKQNGFKALVYLHRCTPDTVGKLRVDYLHRLQRVYAEEIERMQDMADNSGNPREAAASAKQKEKLQKQLKECREYDEKIAHLALARIELDLDDGVKVNYEKLQTAADGKKYPVLGKI